MRLATLIAGFFISASSLTSAADLAASDSLRRPLNSELRPLTRYSPAYLSKVGGHIRRFIVYIARTGEERAMNPMARFSVRMSPNGEIESIRLIQTSGFKNWDVTAARAIENSSPLPLPEEGGPPAEIEVLIQPKEDR